MIIKKDIENAIKKKLYIRFFILLILTNLSTHIFSFESSTIDTEPKIDSDQFEHLVKIKISAKLIVPSQANQLVSIIDNHNKNLIKDVALIQVDTENVPTIEEGNQDFLSTVTIGIPKHDFHLFIKMSQPLKIYPNIDDVSKLLTRNRFTYEIDY